MLPLWLALGAVALAADPGDAPVVHGGGLFMLILLPDDVAYPIGVVTLDRAVLHVEARYNYEGALTGSLFAGANFEVGDEVTFSATPMLGFAFGDTLGVAPGWKVDLAWRFLDLYSEGEVLVDLKDPSQTFLYAWSELNVWPADFARFGLALQRTRAYGDPVFFQPGVFAGLTDGVIGVSMYVFGLALDEPTFEISVSLAL